VLQTTQRLPADRRNLPLGHDVERHNVGQAAALHELHHDPQFPRAQIAVNEVDNVGVRALLHDQDLVDDQVLLWLLLEVHLLDGHQAVGPPLVARVHAARSALADLGEAAVDLPRIALGTYPLQRGDHVNAVALPWPVPRPRARLRKPSLLCLWHPAGAIRISLLHVLVLRRRRGRLLPLARLPPQLAAHGCLRLCHCLLLLLLQQLLLVSRRLAPWRGDRRRWLG